MLIESSVEISPGLIEAVENDVLPDRTDAQRKVLAQQIAALAKAELPAALGAELAFNLLSNQIRKSADRGAQGQAALMRALHDAKTSSSGDRADLAEYRRLLDLALEQSASSTYYYCTYQSPTGISPVTGLPSRLRSYRWAVLEGSAGSGKSVVIRQIAKDLSSTETELVVLVDLKSWSAANLTEDYTPNLDEILEFSAVKIDLHTVERLCESLPDNAV